LVRIDIDSDDVESTIENLEEIILEENQNETYDDNDKEIIKNRIKQIKSMIPSTDV